MTEYTKGPWKTGRHVDNGDIVVRDSNKLIIANCTVDSDLYRPEVQMANAKLIAKAPELLEEIESLLSSLNGYHDRAFGGICVIDEVYKRETEKTKKIIKGLRKNLR